MKKLYNVIFPIWLILILPPIVLLVIPSNFVIDSVVLLASLKLLKMTNIFEKYKSSILKIWLIGFAVDIFGSLLLLLTQFIPTNDYLYQNLVYPLAWNPFNSILAFIYALLVVIICAFLIYIINYKFSLKKVDIEVKTKKKVALFLALFTAPYLFLLPTSYFYTYDEYNNLEKYYDSYVGDNSAVGNILSNIYSGKYYDIFELQTDSKPYEITITYKNSEYGDIYKNLEQDVSILFNLIQNVDIINFKIDKTYSFTREDINKIYNDVRKISIKDIEMRYSDEKFEKFTYLGHVDNYDIFDTDTTCGIEKNQVYTDDTYNYYIECANIDSLYLVNDSSKIKVSKALEENKIKVADLFKTNLKITKGSK